MEDILKYLELDIEKLNDELSKKDDKLDFFNDFLINTPKDNFFKLGNVSKDKLLLASLLLIDEPFLFESLENISCSYKKTLDSAEGIYFIKLKNLAVEYSKLTKEELLQIHNLVERKINIGKVSNNVKNIYQKIIDDMDSLFIDDIKYLALLDLSLLDFDKSIGTINKIYNLRELCNIVKTQQMGLSLLFGDKQKFKVSEFKKFLEDINETSSLQLIYNSEKFINELLDEGSKYQQQANKRKRELLNKKKREIKLQNLINKAINTKEIINSKEILELIDDPILKDKIVKNIYLHNNKYYDELDNEYRKLNQNTSLNYQILLSKYGISMDSYDVGSIMNNNIDDTKDMLEKLNKIGICDSNTLIKILQNSTIDIVNYIHNLCLNNTISHEFFHNNSYIFNKNNSKLTILKNNLRFLQDEKISSHLFSSSEEILLTNTLKLRENIDILNKYSMLNNLKSGMNLNFIGYKDLDIVIDSFLELGYLDILNKNMDLLNYKDRIGRLYLLKQMNIPITNYDDLVNILTTDRFMVSDKEISSYLYNSVLFNQIEVVSDKEPRKKIQEISRLDKYINNKLTYNFNGVIISKNKVEKNLKKLSIVNPIEDRLFTSIIKNSILDDEDINNIKNCIYEHSKKI